jgi:hypothetical protein
MALCRMFGFALLLSIALTACARTPKPTPIYDKAGATQQDFAQDRYACEQENPRSQFGTSVFAEGRRHEMVEHCLEANGWVLRQPLM